VVLVIDTSSHLLALAVIGAGAVVAEDVAPGGRERDIAARAESLVDVSTLEAVVVSLGPGSFTGLRVGVSYGVGLAMGLGVPLLALGSLELQAARAIEPVLALVEAGRGRVYWLEPGGEARLGEPPELPRAWPAAGWLRPETADAVRAAGVRLLAETDLAGFGAAAARLAGAAKPVRYDTVKLKYMQSFGSVSG
jgi:tRNA threonylcarbamoyl adenosine modification protein YeaZ